MSVAVKNTLSKLVMLLAIAAVFNSCSRADHPVVSASNDSTANAPDASLPKPAQPSPVPSEEPSVTTGVSLSLSAREISVLLDKGHYNAAEALFKTYIPETPSDAGLYCQYVRYLIEAFDIEDDPFIASPIKPDDKYRTSALVIHATSLASEFDPQVKPYLADIILKGIYDHIHRHAERGETYIRSATELTGGRTLLERQFQAVLGGGNKVLLAWEAIKLDASMGKTWAGKYEGLVPLFIKSGMSASAMWTANLSGDLSNGADETSNVDFERATISFLRALDTRNSKAADINIASSIYVSVFEKDVKRVFSAREVNYARLISTIKREGGNLRPFEELGALPSSMKEDSNANQD